MPQYKSTHKEFKKDKTKKIQKSKLQKRSIHFKIHNSKKEKICGVWLWRIQKI